MKLALGTVQFGLDYGIANKSGKILKEDAFKILEYAHNAGIDTLDTAGSYGDSEKIIGDFIADTAKKFNVISKMPALTGKEAFNINEDCQRTLKKLKTALEELESKHSDLNWYGGSLDSRPLRVGIKQNGKNIAAINTRSKDMFLKLEFSRSDYSGSLGEATKHKTFNWCYPLVRNSDVEVASVIINEIKNFMGKPWRVRST